MVPEFEIVGDIYHYSLRVFVHSILMGENMSDVNDKEKISEGKREEIDAFLVIGGFLVVFGFTILIAIFFTPTFHGKITNLISGLILLTIGFGGVLKSNRFAKRKK